jgi:glycosyltransferase involved in cell wall biosynthesis
VCYLGSPLKKDRLGELLLAVESLNSPTSEHLELILGGFTFEDVQDIPGINRAHIEALGERVRMVGRLTRTEVIRILAESHFSILIRDASASFVRYGFPSKVPESLAAGCPFLGNATSDLGWYLEDGHNALLIETVTVQSVARALTRAVETVTSGTHAQMQKSARTTAELYFDARGWGTKVSTWWVP